MQKKFFIYRYDKILKTCDYFQNINITVVFILIKFLFYMQNTVPIADFKSLYLYKQIFIYIYEKIDMIKF